MRRQPPNWNRKFCNGVSAFISRCRESFVLNNIYVLVGFFHEIAFTGDALHGFGTGFEFMELFRVAFILRHVVVSLPLQQAGLFLEFGNVEIAVGVKKTDDGNEYDNGHYVLVAADKIPKRTYF